jgi:hypothetical protein
MHHHYLALSHWKLVCVNQIKACASCALIQKTQTYNTMHVNEVHQVSPITTYLLSFSNVIQAIFIHQS